MMNSFVAQSRSFSTWTEVFRIGQSPKYWRRELLQQTDWLPRLLRSGAWIEELKQLKPLLDQPLLGSSLEQLTAQGALTSAVARKQTSQPPRHFNHPPPTSSSNQRMQNVRIARAALLSNPDSVGPQQMRLSGLNALRGAVGVTLVSPTSEKIAKGSRLSPRAEGNLLRRLAGSAADDVSNHNVYIVNEKLSRVAPPVPVGRASPPDPFLKTSLPARHWRDLVSHRAAKNFLRDWPAETFSLVSSREVEGVSPSMGGSPLLEEHWITPVDGPAAPAEILIDLARLTEVSDAAAVSEIKWPKARSPADNISSSTRSQRLSQDESARRRIGERADGTHQSFSTKHSESLPAPDDRLVIQEVDHWRESAARLGNRWPATHGLEWTEFHDADGSSAESNLAPATLTPSLPPLLPPASPGSPALPMAAATSRYGAWRGEVDAPEKDLSLLAAQMKRILDEEARRHGIDV